MPEDVEPPEADVSGVLSESENEYDDHDTDMHIKDEDEKMADHNTTPEDGDTNGEVKKKYDPKDPLRPRRKKARRACYACQRAHLTCGDERPCQRCIKRGLADACQDGVRKKAKYLHDAPPEALRPVLGPTYNPSTASTRSNGNHHPSMSSETSSTAGTFFPGSTASQFPVFPSTQTPITTIPDDLPFGGGQSPVSPTFQQQPSASRLSGITLPQVQGDSLPFTSPLFDMNNSGPYFNLDSLNFGSHYGAMEWNILNQMSSGAADTPPRDPSSLPPQKGASDVAFGPAGAFGNGINHYEKVYEGGLINDLLSLDQRGNGVYSQGNLQHGLPHAYAIPAGPANLQSPSTETNSPQPSTIGFEGSPTTASFSGTAVRPRAKPPPGFSKLAPHAILGKRQRDPSYIYETVKEPFPYVASFHKLISLLKKRFPAGKVQHIAKSLASIRQPFISCTRTLSSPDFVFMEKCFQRALFEYEEFSHQCSSALIICRRTGEVAMANHQFSAVTGWSKEVLLGNMPNLNVNKGNSAPLGAASDDSSGRGGLTTPLLKNLNLDAPDDQQSRPPRPVFLAELMDDESVVEFYDDYANLAFNNSRGTTTRTCRLLKYQTQEMLDKSPGNNSSSSRRDSNINVSDTSPQQKDTRGSILSNRVAKIDGEHGISRLEKDGKLDCTYTWIIKRDTFDMPMMIVVNFLPRLDNNSQLAV